MSEATDLIERLIKKQYKRPYHRPYKTMTLSSYDYELMRSYFIDTCAMPGFYRPSKRKVAMRFRGVRILRSKKK